MTPLPPLQLPVGQMEELQAHYARPPRAYHNFDHVAEVQRHYHEIAGGTGWRQPAEVWLAILYHDAIYEPPRSDNEARSAALAVAEIARWLPDSEVDAQRVSHLIMLTARHGQLRPADVDHHEALFLDSDMAILAARSELFDAYDRGIAAEYAGHVPEALFRQGRQQFLRKLLQSDRIFLSDAFHARHDAQARNNLRRALEGLEGDRTRGPIPRF